MFVSRSPVRTRTGTSGRRRSRREWPAGGAVVRPLQARADRLELCGRPRCGRERCERARPERGASTRDRRCVCRPASRRSAKTRGYSWHCCANPCPKLSSIGCSVSSTRRRSGARSPATRWPQQPGYGRSRPRCPPRRRRWRGLPRRGATVMRPVGRDRERDRVGTQPRGEVGDVCQHGFTAAVAACGAHEPDRPAARRRAGRAPRDRSRSGRRRSGRANGLGRVARGIDRSSGTCRTTTPQIEPLQAERRAYRLDVVGRGGRP